MICPDRLPWWRQILQAVDCIDPGHHGQLGTLSFESLFPDNNPQDAGAVVISKGEQSESGNKMLSARHLDFNRIIVVITMEWTNSFSEGSDLGDIDFVQLKSRFIVHWWESANTGAMNSLPVPVSNQDSFIGASEVSPSL
jgi:hypothetical protein